MCARTICGSASGADSYPRFGYFPFRKRGAIGPGLPTVTLECCAAPSGYSPNTPTQHLTR